MKAPVFTPAVAALTLATVLFSSGTTYSNTRSISAAPAKAAINIVANSQGAFAAAADDQPGYRRYPLIIVRTPGLSITIGDNGRRCYRSPAGYYYWEGRDGRFYLDERYIRYVDYDRHAYRDWDCRDRHHYKKYRKQGRGHGHGNGHGRGHGRGHDRHWDDD
ncbi:hypothetical protein [Pseudoflavitalea rhizosphaerae]|uniref:hypothetical protein n=1 Tax=Pseudoflavitalea rhizosphaerae TaxID=1884793 RepID=UPI000F8E3109|nr:hypothetical protein [Pseudoflavitalea rhizosphaerae]